MGRIFGGIKEDAKEMIARIDLDEIRIYAYHGCYEEEQRVGNWYTVNVSLEVECKKAAESDDVSDALNYVDAYNIIRTEMGQKSHLLENVVMRIVNALRRELGEKGLRGGVVKVSKMAPPVGGDMRSVSLSMSI